MLNFDIAQELFNLYSPLKTNADLSDILSRVLDTNSSNNGTIIKPRELYNDIILKYYPNETSVKSSFINNILLKSKNHISIFELKVGESRADLCKINGTSIAYEIKTDLDNLLRLEKQLQDYLYVFEKVYVICSSSRSECVKDILPPECGLYDYRITKNGQYKFKAIKKASHSTSISPHNQLSILTKRELALHFKQNASLSREDMIQNIITNASKTTINSIFKKCMKLKYQKQWSFLENNYSQIYEIDYQWFYKNTISPSIIYQ